MTKRLKQTLIPLVYLGRYTVKLLLKATSGLTILLRGCEQRAKFKGIIASKGNAGRLLRVKRRRYL